MSVLNVCTTELDRELISRRYRNTISTVPDQRISSLYRRFSWNNSSSTTTDSYDNYSSYTSSSRNSSFEVIFSRLLDALIFTSAIAITAYSYLTGTLAQPFVEAPKPTVLVGYNKRHSHSESSSGSMNKKNEQQHHHHHQHSIIVDPIEDSKRRRTQEWAEQQIIPTQHIHHHHHQHNNSSPLPTSSSTKKRSCSVLDKKVQPLSRDNKAQNNMKREKKRTQSLPVNNVTKEPAVVEKEEDELLSRMEERLQSLIQQGQDALLSPVEYNDTINM